MKNINGVCFVSQQNGHQNKLDYTVLSNFVKKITNVSIVWDVAEIIESGIKKLKVPIKAKNINRIVLVGETPGFIKPLFLKVINYAGLDFEIVNFNEFGIDSNDKIDLAKILILSSINIISPD